MGDTGDTERRDKIVRHRRITKGLTVVSVLILAGSIVLIATAPDSGGAGVAAVVMGVVLVATCWLNLHTTRTQLAELDARAAAGSDHEVDES